MIPAASNTKKKCKHFSYSSAAKKITVCGRPAKFLDTSRKYLPACGIHAKGVA